MNFKKAFLPDRENPSICSAQTMSFLAGTSRLSRPCGGQVLRDSKLVDIPRFHQGRMSPKPTLLRLDSAGEDITMTLDSDHTNNKTSNGLFHKTSDNPIHKQCRPRPAQPNFPNCNKVGHHFNNKQGFQRSGCIGGFLGSNFNQTSPRKFTSSQNHFGKNNHNPYMGSKHFHHSENHMTFESFDSYNMFMHLNYINGLAAYQHQLYYGWGYPYAPVYPGFTDCYPYTMRHNIGCNPFQPVRYPAPHYNQQKGIPFAPHRQRVRNTDNKKLSQSTQSQKQFAGVRLPDNSEKNMEMLCKDLANVSLGCRNDEPTSSHCITSQNSHNNSGIVPEHVTSSPSTNERSQHASVDIKASHFKTGTIPPCNPVTVGKSGNIESKICHTSDNCFEHSYKDTDTTNQNKLTETNDTAIIKVHDCDKSHKQEVKSQHANSNLHIQVTVTSCSEGMAKSPLPSTQQADKTFDLSGTCSFNPACENFNFCCKLNSSTSCKQDVQNCTMTSNSRNVDPRKKRCRPSSKKRQRLRQQRECEAIRLQQQSNNKRQKTNSPVYFTEVKKQECQSSESVNSEKEKSSLKSENIQCSTVEFILGIGDSDNEEDECDDFIIDFTDHDRTSVSVKLHNSVSSPISCPSRAHTKADYFKLSDSDFSDCESDSAEYSPTQDYLDLFGHRDLNPFNPMTFQIQCTTVSPPEKNSRLHTINTEWNVRVKVHQSSSRVKEKKVHFAEESKLAVIHPMVAWSYAYQDARKGQWEQYARDRSRFATRISEVEAQIGRCFIPAHREAMYSKLY